VSQSIEDIDTSIGGYFCSVVDGYEKLLTLNFDTLTADYCEDAIKNRLEPDNYSSAVGRIQIGHDWYLAAVFSKEEADKFELNGLVTIDFNLPGCNDIQATVNKQIAGGDNVLIIFKINRINSQLIKLRLTDVTIRLKSYSGLKIAAKRYGSMIRLKAFLSRRETS
jgi:hypothetical protein